MISRLSISCEERITRKINMEDLKFSGSSAKKKSNNCKGLFKVCVRHFSMLLYLKTFQKNIKNVFISSQNILYLPYFTDDPFVEEMYSDNPKLHDVMS